MPKIADVKPKSRSTRKPLREVSNAVFRPSNSKSTKKNSSPNNQEQDAVTIVGGAGGGDPLDGLLLVHSDLSALIHQIDELLVQALEQKVTNKKEIESFTNVLSEMQTSLKPWLPRLQKAFSSRSIVSDNQLEGSLATKNTSNSIKKDMIEELDSPVVYELDSMVSPSPLVSWRADCLAGGGRQLFMLTPLPRPKGFSSRLKSKLVLEKITAKNTFGPATEYLDVGEEVKPTEGMLSDPVETSTKSTVESGFFSPEKLTKRIASLVVSTPCLKMSPPKSCMLLEPISEHNCKNNDATRKSTPYPVGVVGSEDSEASSSQRAEHLSLKYPELFGIRPAHKLGNVRKVVEESPNWRMSPPKTCILLEPTVINEVETKLKKDEGIETCVLLNKAVESTPLCKDLDTTILRGKRPGENTLKKELWTRFEAATTHGFRFKDPIVEKTAGASDNKGFMDLLEEASCDD